MKQATVSFPALGYTPKDLIGKVVSCKDDPVGRVVEAHWHRGNIILSIEFSETVPPDGLRWFELQDEAKYGSVDLPVDADVFRNSQGVATREAEK